MLTPKLTRLKASAFVAISAEVLLKMLKEVLMSCAVENFEKWYKILEIFSDGGRKPLGTKTN